jgi:hypothetical protein
VLNITHDNLLADTEELIVNQVDDATGALVNDLTVGEFEILITSTPHKESLEDAQFEQGIALRREGVPIPDDVLVENSRLLNKADIAKRMADPATVEYEQKLKAIDLREREATVVKLEAEAEQKRADALKKTREAESVGAGTGEEGRDNDESALKRYEIDQANAIKRYEIDEKMKLERERMRAEADKLRNDAVRERVQNMQSSRTVN